MTLQTSGPISLSQIAGQFGGGQPYHLSSYYAGGGRVPSGTSGTNGAVPSSGTIKMSEFYGTTNFTGQTDTYQTAGSGVETVPSGAQVVVIEVWGGGGGGGCGFTSGSGVNMITIGGGGGGGGGYCRSSYSVLGGQTLNYTVGAAGEGAGSESGDGVTGGTSTVSSGSLSITTLTADGGGAGVSSTHGTGGAASGGNQANTQGGNGTNGTSGRPGTEGSGGSAPSGNGGYNPGGYGGYGTAFPYAGSGGTGAVRFTYS